MNAVYLLFLAAVSAATITPSSQSKELPEKIQGQSVYLTEKAGPFSFTVEGPAAVILKLRGPKVIDATTQFPIRIIRNDKYQTQYSRSLVARRVAPRGYPYGTEIGIQVPAGQQTYTLDTGETVMAVLLSSPKKLPKRLNVKVAETEWVPPAVAQPTVATKKTNPAAKPKIVKPAPAKIAKRAEPKRPVKIKRILIMDVSAVGVDEAIAKQVTAAIAESMSGRAGIETVTSEELTNIAETEVLKQGTGCEADTACMAEISSWANAELVVNGTLGKVGDAITITLSLVDSKNASVENRVSRSISESQNPIDITQSLVEELFGWDGAGNKITYRIAEGKAVSFAVFDLSTAGLSEDAARNLTQVLSVELKRIQGASVIGKEDIAAMLNLEGQKQVLGCDSDTSCLAEIGGALGVDKLVVGQVGKLADNFIISLRLISPTTAKVDNRISENFVGTEATLIPAIRTAGRKLLGIDSKDPGSLGVSSSESQATVFLDGKEYGSLPMPPIQDLTPGRYNLRVLKEGFNTWNGDVYVNPLDNTAMWIELQAKPAMWYEEWWVWASVGGVVAGVATTLAITLKAAPTSGSGSAIVASGQ